MPNERIIFTPQILGEIKRVYVPLGLILNENEDDSLTINPEKMNDKDAFNFNRDILFYVHCPNTPYYHFSSSLDNYTPKNPNQLKLEKIGRLFANDSLESGTKGLFIHGPTGTGKEHIAISIAKEQLLRGKIPRYISPNDFQGDEEEIELKLKYKPITIVKQATDIDFQDLSLIINETYNAGGMIIITSYVPFQELIQIEDDSLAEKRGLERIKDIYEKYFQTIEVTGKSMRGLEKVINTSVKKISSKKKLTTLTSEELRNKLNHAINNEKYEEAAKINKLLRQKFN